MSSSNDNKSSGAGVVFALLAGIAVGAVLGILFAPKSGKETRQIIKEKGEKLIEESKKNIGDIIEKTKDFTQISKQKIEELKMVGEDFVEKGKKTVKNAARVIGTKIGKTKEKIKDVVEEGKSKAKEIEDTLS